MAAAPGSLGDMTHSSSTIRKLVPALVVVAALVAAGCGDDDSSGDRAAAAGGNGVDRAFVAEMVPHHRSAIEMAQIARTRAKSEFVKQLAEDIIRTQADEIRILGREDEGLDMAGVKRGALGVPEHLMGMDHDPATLKTADEFDPAFLKMMIPHHEGAIEMSEAELAKGQDRELRALARNIIAVQRREIAQMRRQLGDDADADAGGGGHG